MHTSVKKEISAFDQIVEVFSLGVLPATPSFKATVDGDGHEATATSNDREAAIETALTKWRKDAEEDKSSTEYEKENQRKNRVP